MNPATLSLFVLWLAYGAYRWRATMRWRDNPPAIAVNRRPLVALAWLFGSAAFLMLALFLVYELGGFPNRGIEPWAWFLSLLAGVVFVHGQVTAAALIFSMAVDGVTNPSSKTSDPLVEVDSVHEKPPVDRDGPGDEYGHPR